MKEKIHYAIEAALAVAVIILFVFHFSGGKKTSNTRITVSEIENVADIMPIAYIDMESLMITYTYSIEITEQLTRQYESSQATLIEQGNRLQTEINEWQRKAQAGAFLTQQRMDDERQRIEKKGQEFEQKQLQLDQELNQERARLQDDLRQAIITHVAEYNKDKGYQLIFGKVSDIILYANEVYNVTDEVIEFLNMKYAEAPVLKSNE